MMDDKDKTEAKKKRDHFIAQSSLKEIAGALYDFMIGDGGGPAESFRQAHSDLNAARGDLSTALKRIEALEAEVQRLKQPTPAPAPQPNNIGL